MSLSIARIKELRVANCKEDRYLSECRTVINQAREVFLLAQDLIRQVRKKLSRVAASEKRSRFFDRIDMADTGSQQE